MLVVMKVTVSLAALPYHPEEFFGDSLIVCNRHLDLGIVQAFGIVNSFVAKPVYRRCDYRSRSKLFRFRLSCVANWFESLGLSLPESGRIFPEYCARYESEPGALAGGVLLFGAPAPKPPGLPARLRQYPGVLQEAGRW